MMARKQLNIRLEEELHTKAKVTAILKGMTLNDYIEQAIQASLEKDKGAASTKMKKLQ
jgi:predicted HicB family RNase H-like nuclease